MEQTIRKFLREGILFSPEYLDETPVVNEQIITQSNKPVVIDKTFFEFFNSGNLDEINWLEYDKMKVLMQKRKVQLQESYIQPPTKHINIPQTGKVEILENFLEQNQKIQIRDFINLYNNRYKALQTILRNRQELQNATTISKVFLTDEKQAVSFIAMVFDIQITKNNNFLITFEDQTGLLKAIVTKNNQETYQMAKDLTPDEVVGVVGSKGDQIVFVNTLIFPETPLNKELKKSPEPEAAVFISDLHIGSKFFLKKNFEKFISWLNGSAGTDTQKDLIKNVKYLFILGDLVEGIGIYPNQEEDLEIKDIYDQYSLFSDYINQIPNNINIVICPGNHDSIRVAEPQPPIPAELVPNIITKSNIFMVSSPSLVKFGSNQNFSGFDVMIYHGFSLPYYSTTIESLRLNGGLEKTENILIYLMKKRHLAPTHGSSQYQFGYDSDPLIIKTAPDFLVTGHIHKVTTHNYRNTTIMNCSCWIAQTEYQEQRGIVPQPCRAIYVDLSSRETKILNFS